VSSVDPQAPPSAPARPPVLLRGWIFFLAAALLVLVGASLAVQARPERYSAQAVVAFVPVGTRPVSATTVTLMVPRYVAYASSPYVVRQAATAVGVPSTELQGGLNVAMPATTANVAITVTAGTPGVAAGAANRIAAIVSQRAAADPVLAARLLASATVPTAPTGAGRTSLLTGAVAAALLAGALAALAARWYGRRRYPWAANRPVNRPLPAPGPGAALATVPLPHASGYPSIQNERLWSRANDTVEMPAMDADDEDTVEFEAASPIQVGGRKR
jgi:capsular polysaccharide biosynthesis protein